MQSVTLKIAHFTDAGRVYVTPGWISNGHWAIRRGLVKNSAIFASVDSILATFPKLGSGSVSIWESDDQIAKMAAQATKKARVWTETAWSVKHAGNQLALYVSEELYTLVNRQYLALLGEPAVLYGPALGVLSDSKDTDTQDFIVMPFASDPVYLAPVVELVHAMDEHKAGLVPAAETTAA